MAERAHGKAVVARDGRTRDAEKERVLWSSHKSTGPMEMLDQYRERQTVETHRMEQQANGQHRVRVHGEEDCVR